MLRKFTATVALAIGLTLVTTVTTLTPQPAHATAQEPDRIIVNGQKFNLTTNPLSAYLQRPGKFPLPGKMIRNTANWRGYIATWEVKDGKLWLNDVEVEEIAKPAAFKDDGYPANSALTTMFGRKGPILADWFSGTLTIPDGEMIAYVHMGYGSTYSHYQVFVVQKGQVTAHHSVTPDEWQALRRAKFAAFQKTAEYRTLRDKLAADLAKKESALKVAAALDVDAFLFDFSTDVYMSR